METKELKDFDSLYELLDYFNTEEKCEEYLAVIRWNGNPECPCCKSRKVNLLRGKTRRYKCYACRKQFSVKHGTIFHDSKIPLRKWYMAIFLLAAHKKGISSYQLASDLKIHQQSAWFMLQRIRETFIPSQKKLRKKTVEVDETYFGGKEKNKHKSKKTPNSQGRSTKTKAALFAIAERNGNIYATPIPTCSGKVLLPIIASKVAKRSKIYTDEYKPYRKLATDYHHEFVNHGIGEYVRGDVHTNTLEGFWSQMKRNIGGVYHHVSKKHLARYVNEATFKHNNQEIDETDRFKIVLAKSNTTLTYKALISGKTETAAGRYKTTQRR